MTSNCLVLRIRWRLLLQGLPSSHSTQLGSHAKSYTSIFRRREMGQGTHETVQLMEDCNVLQKGSHRRMGDKTSTSFGWLRNTLQKTMGTDTCLE